MKSKGCRIVGVNSLQPKALCLVIAHENAASIWPFGGSLSIVPIDIGQLSISQELLMKCMPMARQEVSV